MIAKPGLDGHSNGAEQIAVRARDCGIRIVYEGIRMTAGEIVQRAAAERVDALGLSILSGSHLALVPEIMAGLRARGLGHVPVVVGGIIPEADAAGLRELGVRRVYTPKDFALNTIIAEILDLIDAQLGEAA